MIFATSCYGRAYAPFLAVCLRSLRQSHPDTPVLVTYDGLPRRIVRALDAANPIATFTPHNAALPEDRTRRIGAKLDFWAAALARAEDGETVAFIDADTIVRADLSDALAPDADMLVTVKPETIPINTGVVIMRQSARLRAFLDEWRRMTAELCGDLAKMDTERYGGPTQQALLDLMGDERPEPGRYSADDISIQAEPCSVYNETASLPLSSPAKVLHYKAPWQRILIKDRGYSATRTREACREMRDLWLSMLRAEERETGAKFIPFRYRAQTAWRSLKLRYHATATPADNTTA